MSLGLWEGVVWGGVGGEGVCGREWWEGVVCVCGGGGGGGGEDT